MKIGTAPKNALEVSWDCIWLCLNQRSELEPLKGLIFQRLDWKMGGLISRFVRTGVKESIFVASMGRVAATLLCLDPSLLAGLNAIDHKSGWKRILIVPETPSLFIRVTKCLEGLSEMPFDVSLVQNEG